MSRKQIVVATWNIAGGHTLKGKGWNHSDQENIQYFIDKLKGINLDIICIQESHRNAHRSLSVEIAKALGLQGVFEVGYLTNNCFYRHCNRLTR